MYKKFIVFFCILSLLVPFLPSFDLTVSASDSVSDDDVNGGGGGHSRYNHYTGLLGVINQYLLDNGFVINDSDVITYNVLDTVLEDNFSVDLEDYVSIYDKDTQLDRIYQNFYDNNPSFDYDRFADLLSQFALDYSRSNLTYVARETINVSDFLQVVGVMGTNAGNVTRLNSLQQQLKLTVNGAGSTNVYCYVSTSSELARSGFLYAFPKDSFNDLLFYITSSSFNFDYFQSGNGVFLNATNFVNSSLWTVSNNSISTSLTVKRSTQGLYSNQVSFPSPSDVTVNVGNSSFYFGVNSTVSSGINHAFGSYFIIPDSSENFSFPIFRDSASALSFIHGSSNVYYVGTDFDLGEFPDEIDYNRLYDVVSSSIQDASGNYLSAINNSLINYFQKQVDLLHDINNALNDGEGNSWLRRIYGFLDYNFPLTLQAFDDLTEAIQNISVSGGGDFSEATRVLHEIDDKLGFLIEQPLDDATAQDFDELKSIAGSKFPFCIFSDIVAITVILNRTPRAPDINFPMPTLGSASQNVVHVDLTPYEYARPYVHGALIFLFVIGLMALSVKIFSALKG